MGKILLFFLFLSLPLFCLALDAGALLVIHSKARCIKPSFLSGVPEMQPKKPGSTREIVERKVLRKEITKLFMNIWVHILSPPVWIDTIQYTKHFENWTDRQAPGLDIDWHTHGRDLNGASKEFNQYDFENAAYGRLSIFSTGFKQDPTFHCITFKMTRIQEPIWRWRCE